MSVKQQVYQWNVFGPNSWIVCLKTEAPFLPVTDPISLLPSHSHVQINNESAIDFYQRFGFQIIETKKNYYKRIEPADAHVLQKSLRSPCAPPSGELQKTE